MENTPSVVLTKLAITDEELQLLRGLLRFEVFIQITSCLASDKYKTTEEKVLRMMNIIDSYRNSDDFLEKELELLKSHHSYLQLKALNQLPLAHLVLPINVMEFYKFLCTETVKAGLPTWVTPLWEKHGAMLSTQVEAALSRKLVVIPNLKKKESNNKSTETIKETDKIEDPLKINILGKKGLA